MSKRTQPKYNPDQLSMRLGDFTDLQAEMRELFVKDVLVIDPETVEKARAHRYSHNIGVLGVLQAPVVEEVKFEHGTKYSVLDGRHRVQAALELGLEKIWCKVFPTLTNQQRAAITLSTNLLRRPNPKAELASVIELLKQFSQEELHLLLAKADKAIKEQIKLAMLPKPLTEQYLTGQITRGVLRQAALLKPEQLSQVAQQSGGFSCDGETLSQLIQSVRQSQKPMAEALSLPGIDETFDFSETEAENVGEEKDQLDYLYMLENLKGKYQNDKKVAKLANQLIAAIKTYNINVIAS